MTAKEPGPDTCPDAQPGRAYCGDVACGCMDLPFTPLREQRSAPRRTAADAANPVADIDSYLDVIVNQACAQTAADPATATALCGELPRALAQCRELAVPLKERVADAQMGMNHGLFGLEVMAEIEMREVLLVDLPLLQAAQSRLVRRGAEATDAARTRRHATTETLAVIASAVQASRTFVGRRSCARGDDAASANLGCQSPLFSIWTVGPSGSAVFCISRRRPK